MDDEGRWRCLYPVYFDAGRSLGAGRRVPQTHCVPGGPSAAALRAACEALGLACRVEADRRHPRAPGTPGRVRVSPAAVGDGARFASMQALRLAVGAALRSAQPVRATPAPSQTPAPGLAVRRKTKGKAK